MAHNGTSNGNGRRKAKDTLPKWTIMIYLAGDYNLSSHCITILQQLEAVAYKEDVQVLACFDSNSPAPKGSRYLEISRRRRYVDNGFDWELHNDLVLPEDRGHLIKAPDFCDSSSNGSQRRDPSFSRPEAAEGVRRFINWAVDNHEAERYMLIFMGHGPLVASKTFLAKENPPSFMRLADMRRVLSKRFGAKMNRKLSILACHNCAMNGIETAIEVKDEVEFMIGSQGLMLAAGWPYQRVVESIVKDPDAPTETIARRILQACARNLLDFTLMDRSSEQSVCDLTKLGEQDNIVTALKSLVGVLNDALAFQVNGDQVALKYPAICDAVRLARLDAQSFWGETFVDLYDFCDRLLQKCQDLYKAHTSLLKDLGFEKDCDPKAFRTTDLVGKLREIIRCCLDVLAQAKRMVPESYYIGPELQYSHGLSIYFPWTRPEAPFFFTKRPRRMFSLQTAFETYRNYEFARKSGWSTFLESFFRATLRRVRRAERTFSITDVGASLDSGLVAPQITPPAEVVTLNLHKTSSDTGNDDRGEFLIKNYPRRNYLSPADCPRKIEEAGNLRPGANDKFENPTNPPVSYLGWNMPQLVAEVITPQKKPVRRPSAKAKTVGASY